LSKFSESGGRRGRSGLTHSVSITAEKSNCPVEKIHSLSRKTCVGGEESFESEVGLFPGRSKRKVRNVVDVRACGWCAVDERREEEGVGSREERGESWFGREVEDRGEYC